MRTFSTAFLILAFVLPLSGCSAVGFVIGSLSDSSRPDYDTVGTSKVWQLRPNQDIVVLKTDGTQISGELFMVDTIPGTEYHKAYDIVKLEPEGSGMPAIGDTVNITFRSGIRRPSLQGIFVGFDPGIFHIRLRENLVTIPLETVNALNGHQNTSVNIDTVRGCISRGLVPFMSQLLLNNGTETRGIRLDGVREIYLENYHSAKWIGLGVGVALDILIIHLIHQGDRPESTSFW